MSNTKERFAKFYVNIWFDSKVTKLDLFEERFFKYSFTNMNSIRHITGIYEINRETLGPISGFIEERIKMLSKYGLKIANNAKSKNFAGDIINTIIDSFNSKHKHLLEYYVPEHIMYVKNYFKFQSRTIGNASVAIRMILNEFRETGKKVEMFWKEFGDRNTLELADLLKKLIIMLSNAELSLATEKAKDKEKQDSKYINKLQELIKEYIELIPKFEDFLKKVKT